MITKRSALSAGMLFVLLLGYACAPAATAESSPPEEPYSYVEPAATEAYASEEYSYESPAQPKEEAYLPSDAPYGSRGDEPYDMFFEDYGVNPSIDTEDDHLSTFSLDVDTGSYTIMRNYLSDGNLPPTE